MRHGLFISVFAFVICSAWTPEVGAQDAAAAEALFRSAREAAEQGDWVTACDRFEESKRLEPAPGTVLNLARCRENLGEVASAWKSYTEAVQRLPARDERHAFARKKSIELEARVPYLILNAPRTESDVVVSVDGTELSSASFGVPLPIDPGEVEVVVQAKGHETKKTALTLAEGDEVTHQLELGPRAAGVSAGSLGGRSVDERPSAEKGKGSALPFFILGGVGAAAAIGGGIWAGIELPKVKDEENCLNGSCTEVGADAAARGRVAVYILGAGSVLAVGGFSLGAYFSSKKEAQVSLAPLPGGGAIFWRTDL